MREVEDLMANAAAWGALPAAERAEKEKHYNQNSECLLLLDSKSVLDTQGSAARLAETASAIFDLSAHSQRRHAAHGSLQAAVRSDAAVRMARETAACW